VSTQEKVLGVGGRGSKAKALDQVQKLLALAASSTFEGEAENAREKAKALLANLDKPKTKTTAKTAKKTRTGEVRWTEKAVSELEAGSGWWRVEGKPGRRIYAGATTKTLYIVKRLHSGKVATIKVCTVGEGGIALRDAEKLAGKILGRIADGQDPGKEKAEKRAEEQSAQTLRAYGDVFLEGHGLFLKERTYDEYERMLKRGLPGWLLAMQLKDIRREHLKKHHTEMRRHKREADNRLSVLSKLYAYAKESGDLPESWISPTVGIKRYRPKGKADAKITDEQYRLLGRALEDAERDGTITAKMRAFYRTLAMSGMRLTEARTLKWSQIEKGSIWLPDAKGGAQPLAAGEELLALLKGLERVDGSEYVFANPESRTGEPFDKGKLTKKWQKVRARVGLNEIVLHTFRHGCEYMASEDGNAFASRDFLRHATMDMANHYAARNPRRELANKISSRVTDLMNGTVPAEDGGQRKPAPKQRAKSKGRHAVIDVDTGEIVGVSADQDQSLHGMYVDVKALKTKSAKRAPRA
jgi:integrase